MQTLRKALHVARLESQLFRRFPKLRLSVLGIILIPAAYAYIYLASMWDPAAHTASLPAAIVNLDRGTTIAGQPVNVGADVVRKLYAKHLFGFYDSPDPDAARSDVRQGHSLFALIIPPDFSANAMAANAAGSGKLVIFTSEGNNYTGSGFARRFATELGHQVNETLNEKRWEAVLRMSASSTQDLQRLREGVDRLRDGAAALDAGMGRAQDGADRLAAGADRLQGGIVQLTDGVERLGAGAHLIDSKRPAVSDLHALKDGAARLSAGQDTLQQGLPKLVDGAARLAQGAAELRDRTRPIPFVGGRISDGAAQLADGATRLQAGAQRASDGATQLADGSRQLEAGVDRLADGFDAYANGVSLLASKFPTQTQLAPLSNGGAALASGMHRLDNGLGQLKSGSSRLAAGLVTLADALPAAPPHLSGTALGLATSVEPEVEVDAPVRNNGIGFAPNFIPLSLWLGAVLVAFVFHLRRLPQTAEGNTSLALLLGKLFIFGSINILQAFGVLAMCWFLLGLHPVHLIGLTLTMITSSLTFMLIILLLVRILGDFGKGAGLILLILQLSAAGGIIPIELSSRFYRTLSPLLPFTWSVKAVRASAFGAFEGRWQPDVAILAGFGLTAFLLSLLVGRWLFTPPDQHRPAIDI